MPKLLHCGTPASDSLHVPHPLVIAKQNRSGVAKEWVYYRNPIHLLVGLQVFCEQVTAGNGFRCSYDQCIPERELIAILDFPSPFKNRPVNCDRAPGQEISDLRARLFAGTGPSLCDVHIKFLQDLETDSTAVALPQFSPPRPGRLLFLQIASVYRVDENICINEDGRGHELPRARGSGHWS